MPDLLLLILSIGVVFIILLQIVLLLRKRKADLPTELLLRLDGVEQTSRATLQAVAKNEGALHQQPGQGVMRRFKVKEKVSRWFSSAHKKQNYRKLTS